ncbi:MAG: three-Cys-motif partner protein TcmP [Rubrobacteraceae bacterium]
MSDAGFFEESKEQSRIKAEIVRKYFWAWANVVVSVAKSRGEGRIAYIDLFAGPGRYKDGTKSTPLLVLESAVQKPDLRKMLVTLLNDKDSENVRSLQNAIESTPEFEQFEHKPQVWNNEVGSEIVAQFESMNMVPTLFFVDPWGYKGLSLKLINSVLKNWGSDCIIFFNYNRINMGLNNEYVKEHMDALFGEARAERLRERLKPMSPQERELEIVEEIAEALKEMGGKYVLPFRFRDEKGNRASHHLIFVSKHFKGYEIMKGVMAGESSAADQGVPSLEYNPATKDQRLLFELSRPLDELEGQLLNDFAGRTLTMRQIYEEHSVGRPFTDTNYKEALKKLEAKGAIETNPSIPPRRKNTFAKHVSVTFPAR